MVDFRVIINNLIDIGFYSVILPFFLVYVVVFAILEKSDIFKGGSSGDKSVKNINAVIAFVFGLFVVASVQTVLYIQELILNVVLILIFILVLLITLGLIFGNDLFKLFRNAKGEVNSMYPWIIGVILFLILLGITFSILGVWSIIGDWWDSIGNFDTNGISTWIVLIGIGLIMYWITKSDDDMSKNKKESK